MPHDAKGFCHRHYARWARHGDPLAGRTFVGKPQVFFETVVLAHQGDECLIWPFAKLGRGYGQVALAGKKVGAHRAVCEKVHGPAPSDQHYAAHNCGQGHLGCVAPRHVRWASPSENQADRVRHGTHCRGSAAPRVKLTIAQVREIRTLLGSQSSRALARRFNVSHRAIEMIKARKTWAWLDALPVVAP